MNSPKEILQNIKYNKDFKSSFIGEEESIWLIILQKSILRKVKW